MTKIEILLHSPQTVFTVDDLAVLWKISERKRLWGIIKYYLRKKRLQKIYRGVYVLDAHYSNLELAVNLFAPAYISLETALGIHGINVQFKSDIQVMSLSSKVIILPEGDRFIFHKLKNSILFNQIGLLKEKNFFLASPERAICDTLYLQPHFVFDNLRKIDEKKLVELVSIYENQALTKRIQELLPLIEKDDL